VRLVHLWMKGDPVVFFFRKKVPLSCTMNSQSFHLLFSRLLSFDYRLPDVSFAGPFYEWTRRDFDHGSVARMHRVDG
jgi:hypothetical protein